MRRRLVIYIVIGALFGAFDYIYLDYLYRVPWDRIFGASPSGQAVGQVVGFLILNVGLWLVPVVPIALYEVRLSQSVLRSALACLLTWWTAIVAYYLTNAAELAFWGVPGRPELHVSNLGSPHFWDNWGAVLQLNILAGITEWTLVAVVGGAIVGSVTAFIYLRLGRTTSTQGRPST